jgi:membrane protein DedA with SNARE-associated domain
VAGFIFLEDFGTPFVPGETVLIAASVYAGAGRLNVAAVALLAVVAAVLGDNLGFVIGHFAGREAVARWGRYVLLTEERLAKAEAFFARHGGKIVTVARFIDGLRQANGIVAGLAEMPWASFLLFNAVGAVAWVACWVTVGYAAGTDITPIYDWFSRIAIYVLVVVGAVVVGFIARHMLRRRRTSVGRGG